MLLYFGSLAWTSIHFNDWLLDREKSMLKPGLLSKFGITVPDGKICTAVNVTVQGKHGKRQIIETITSPKRLEKNALKTHGTLLDPVFVSASDEAI